jgi:hypothetical protein
MIGNGVHNMTQLQEADLDYLVKRKLIPKAHLKKYLDCGDS